MKQSTYWLTGALFAVAVPGCSLEAGSIGSDSEPAESTTEAGLALDCSPDDALPLAVDCDQLAASLTYPNTTFISATSVAEGAFPQPGQTIPAHCLLVGKMFERVGPIDGQAYAIGFEMRLPVSWSRRFFYQANGGLDGAVVPAVGNTSGGGPLTSALMQGFAVISSDAGHDASQVPSFGIDPQARLDFGYQAVGKLTPMAKSVLGAAYGTAPAYSYIGGCSNGGRHTMVAAARYPDEYDGYLVGAPGFNLPKAAVANIYGAQQYAPLSGGAVIPGGPFAGLPDLSAAFTQAERQLLSDKVLEQCDALDGAVDGMVQRTEDCQSAFNLATDVPTCAGPRDGTCLSAAQKVAIGNLFSGAELSDGSPVYSSFPFDTGYAVPDAAFWEFIAPLLLDPSAVGFVFGTPPVNPATFNPVFFALTGSIDQMYASTFATSATYTESGQSFMVPPGLEALSALHRRGKRMIVYHGVSDPIFSADDTVRWFESLNGRGAHNAQLYLVPGMSHCSNGPATDQFDLLTPLVRWVEGKKVPKRVVASARGPGNPGGANADLPVSWSATRTRPLCAYPRVAVYRGGDVERAESFDCKR
jgi:pimeloyl-ACP methyl ester carboxylesterase